MKFLLWLAIVCVVVWLLRSKKSWSNIDPERHAHTCPRPAGVAEPIVRCVQCGMHVPVSEAVRNPSGATFCREEHCRRHVPS